MKKANDSNYGYNGVPGIEGEQEEKEKEMAAEVAENESENDINFIPSAPISESEPPIVSQFIPFETFRTARDIKGNSIREDKEHFITYGVNGYVRAKRGK